MSKLFKMGAASKPVIFFCDTSSAKIKDSYEMQYDKGYKDAKRFYTKEIRELKAEIKKLKSGEYICTKCGIRQDMNPKTEPEF